MGVLEVPEGVTQQFSVDTTIGSLVTLQEELVDLQSDVELKEYQVRGYTTIGLQKHVCRNTFPEKLPHCGALAKR